MSIKYRSRGGFVPASAQALAPLFAMRSRYFLIFDRDGTLVALSDAPDKANFLPSQIAVFDLLHNSNLDIEVAVVSARGLQLLNRDFGMERRFILAGNYGLELSFPTGMEIVHPAAMKAQTTIANVYQRIREEAASIPLIYDYHVFSLCVHFHTVADTELDTLHQLMESYKTGYPDVRFERHDTSYEVRPDIEWTKADALDAIVSQRGPIDKDTLCIAFGDSQFDEPMFHWANQHQGMSFRVGPLDGNTEAMGAVDSPEDVYVILEELLQVGVSRAAHGNCENMSMSGQSRI